MVTTLSDWDASVAETVETEEQTLARIAELYGRGWSVSGISRKLGVPRGFIEAVLRVGTSRSPLREPKEASP
jgi:hypothetical protein